jgi:hypothetical protein
MQNLYQAVHPAFIPMTQLVVIWDFGFRISDLWNRSALAIKIWVEILKFKIQNSKI